MTPSNETMLSQASVPALPLTLVDLVLATVPRIAPGRTPSVTLLHVLSPFQQLPSTLCAVLLDAVAPSTRTTLDLEASLANLVKFPLDQIMIRRMKPALARQPRSLGAKVVQHLAGAGLVSALIFLRDTAPIAFEQYPGALDLATSNGQLDVLVWWDENNLPVQFSRKGIDAAVKNGHLHALEWAYNRASFREWLPDVVTAAAIYGSIPILEWCRARSAEFPNGSPFLHCFFPHGWEDVSGHGHIQVLEWAKRNAMAFPASSVDAIDMAISEGRLAVVEWWYTESPLPFQYSVWGTTTASKNGHVHVLEWLALSGMEMRFSYRARQAAIAHGHKAVAEWWDKNALFNFLQQGRHKHAEPWRRVPTDFATLCSFGQLDLISPSMVPRDDNAYPVLSLALSELASAGHLDVIIHFKDEFYPIAQEDPVLYLSEAVSMNQVHVLQWFKTHFDFHGVHMRVWVNQAKRACKKGHFEVLDWMFANKYVPIPVPTQLVESAMVSGKQDVLDLLLQKSSGGLSNEVAIAVLSAAAGSGQLKSLQWWLEKQLPFPAAAEIADTASWHGHWIVLEWLHTMQPTVPFVWSEYGIRAAVRGKHAMTCKWWLRSGLVKVPMLVQTLKDAVT